MLYTADSRPVIIFFICTFIRSERMFFVTLLLSAVETWMRTQSGSSYIARAALYG